MTDKSHTYDPFEHESLPEGEEAPPPLTRTMGIVRWIILGGMALFALVMVLGYFGLTPWAGADSGPTQYHCPMHPTYVSSHPGDCPICGMSLVPINNEGGEITADSLVMADSEHTGHMSSVATSGQYTCPMHPEVVSDEPGRCSKCNMFLEKVPEPSASESDTTWICTMCPEVRADKPGECPKCGMDLVPEVSTESTGRPSTGADHSLHANGGTDEMGEAPVPGLVSVTIEPQRLQLIGVKTARVQRRPLDGNLHLVGFVTPDETRLFNVHVRFSGWVKELFVDQTGQFVNEDQKLLSIYSQDLYQAEQDYVVALKATGRVAADIVLKDARIQLLNAARQRLELLGVPQDELARLDSAQTPSLELWIPSPFSGYVLEKNVVKGQFIGPDQNLFTVGDLRRVWVLADVYERDLAAVKKGQHVRAQIDAFPGESFEGNLQFIYPVVSEQTRTAKVRIEMPNPDMKLRPGMYAQVTVDQAGHEVLAVTADAVMDGGDKQYAFVVHEQTHFEPRLITVGQRSNDWIEILAGLREGEEVVTSANFLIDSESRLKAAIAGMGGTQADAHAGHGK